MVFPLLLTYQSHLINCYYLCPCLLDLILYLSIFLIMATALLLHLWLFMAYPLNFSQLLSWLFSFWSVCWIFFHRTESKLRIFLASPEHRLSILYRYLGSGSFFLSRNLFSVCFWTQAKVFHISHQVPQCHCCLSLKSLINKIKHLSRKECKAIWSFSQVLGFYLLYPLSLVGYFFICFYLCLFLFSIWLLFRLVLSSFRPQWVFTIFLEDSRFIFHLLSIYLYLFLFISNFSFIWSVNYPSLFNCLYHMVLELHHIYKGSSSLIFSPNRSMFPNVLFSWRSA